MVWTRLPNVILCSGVGYHLQRYHSGTALNVTISWHGTTVTILRFSIHNAGTSAKCITIVPDNIYGTKCNNND